MHIASSTLPSPYAVMHISPAPQLTNNCYPKKDVAELFEHVHTADTGVQTDRPSTCTALGR